VPEKTFWTKMPLGWTVTWTWTRIWTRIILIKLKKRKLKEIKAKTKMKEG